MSLLKGSIYMTTNPSVVSSTLRNNGTVIFIGDTDENILEVVNTNKNANIGSCLLPPYNIMVDYFNGQYNEFAGKYINYLNTPDIQLFLNTIIKGCILGNNILLYMNKDESEFYFSYLFNYLANNFGIFIGLVEQNGVFKYDANFDNKISKHLLYNNLLTYEEFLKINTERLEDLDTTICEILISSVLNDSKVNVSKKENAIAYIKYLKGKNSNTKIKLFNHKENK